MLLDTFFLLLFLHKQLNIKIHMRAFIFHGTVHMSFFSIMHTSTASFLIDLEIIFFLFNKLFTCMHKICMLENIFIIFLHSIQHYYIKETSPWYV